MHVDDLEVSVRINGEPFEELLKNQKKKHDPTFPTSNFERLKTPFDDDADDDRYKDIYNPFQVNQDFEQASSHTPVNLHENNQKTYKTPFDEE